MYLGIILLPYRLTPVIAVGDIHIWDRESGDLLKHIHATTTVDYLTSVAWNPMSDSPYMFATGHNDGCVRIWSNPPDAQSPSSAPRKPAMLIRPSSQLEIPRTDSPVSVSDATLDRQYSSSMRRNSLRRDSGIPSPSRSGTWTSSEGLLTPRDRSSKSVSFMPTPGDLDNADKDGQETDSLYVYT